MKQADRGSKRRWMLVIELLLLALGIAAVLIWRSIRAAAVVYAGLSPSQLYLPCSGLQMRGLPPLAEAKLVSSHVETGTPGSAVRDGDVIHANAVISCPPLKGRPVLVYGDDGMDKYAPLYDDGTHGDTAAQDGTWETDLVWKQEYYGEVGKSFVWVVLGFTGNHECIPGEYKELLDASK